MQALSKILALNCSTDAPRGFALAGHPGANTKGDHAHTAPALVPTSRSHSHGAACPALPPPGPGPHQPLAQTGLLQPSNNHCSWASAGRSQCSKHSSGHVWRSPCTQCFEDMQVPGSRCGGWAWHPRPAVLHLC